MKNPTNQNNIPTKNSLDQVKNLLAEHLGVEPDDINEDDSFTDELHMTPADLSDFIEKLKESGIEISVGDFSNIETVGDLLERISSETLIE